MACLALEQMLCAGKQGKERVGPRSLWALDSHPPHSLTCDCAHRAYGLEGNEWGCREQGKGDVFIKKGIKQFTASYVLEASVAGEEEEKPHSSDKQRKFLGVSRKEEGVDLKVS